MLGRQDKDENSWRQMVAQAAEEHRIKVATREMSMSHSLAALKQQFALLVFGQNLKG